MYVINHAVDFLLTSCLTNKNLIERMKVTPRQLFLPSLKGKIFSKTFISQLKSQDYKGYSEKISKVSKTQP